MYGVEQVNNELEVRILTDDRRDDADLRGAVLHALALVAPGPSAHDLQHSIKNGMERKRQARRRIRLGREQQRDRHPSSDRELVGRS